MSSSFSKHFARLQIPLEDIISATNSFSATNLIGENPLRKTYRGTLSRSEQQIDIVAVSLKGKDKDRNAILQREIWMLSTLNHENLVSVVGFCDEKEEKIIIYKHEANESLGKHLRDSSLTWMRRLEICVGVAYALRYIHYDKERNFSLIHCNVKSSQILLDANWNPKLSGFRFSKIVTAARRNRLHLANLNGTKGYIDPSYEKTRGVTHKTDVYSFGVVLFEVLCGKRAYTSPDDHLRFSDSDHKSPEVVKKLDPIVEHDADQDSERELTDVQENMGEIKIEHSNLRSTSSSSSSEGSFVGKLDEIAQDDGPTQELDASVKPKCYYLYQPPLGNVEQQGYLYGYGSPSMPLPPPPPSSPPRMGAWDFLNPFESFERFYSDVGDDLDSEALTGEHGIDIDKESLLAPLAIFHYDDGTLERIIDPNLWNQMDKDSFKIFSETAYNCLKEDRAERPHIDQIIIRLDKALDLQRKHECKQRKRFEENQPQLTFEGYIIIYMDVYNKYSNK